MPMTARLAPYSLFVVDDDMPSTPRKDCDHIGKMICFHSRYTLGDPHDYSEPKEFLKALLLSEYTTSDEPKNRKPVYHYIKSGQAKNVRLVYSHADRQWELQEKWDYDDCWYISAHYPAALKNTSIPKQFFEDCLAALEVTDLVNLAHQIRGLVLLPLYLYDHSGITMSCSPFSCPWDSGQVGWIYATPDKLRKEYGNLRQKTIDAATKVLIGEVKEYDAYLTGQCYGYRLFRDTQEVDSCYGFLGDLDDITAQIKDYLPEDCDGKIVDMLENCDVEPSIFDYLGRCAA